MQVIDAWKEVYLAGTEWDQFSDVDRYPWDFGHLDDAINEGNLKDGKLFVFGTTEPQLVNTKEHPSGTVIPIPVIIVVSSKLAPPSTVSIKSVQRVEEEILPMSRMKMGWYPLVPPGVDPIRGAKSQRLYVLKCEQRRAGLKNLKIDRLKQYEYVLPYIFFPEKQEEEVPDTVINMMVDLVDGGKPLVFEYDYELDDIDEFVPEKLKEEDLDGAKYEAQLRDEIKKQVKATKMKQKAEREAMKKEIDNMSTEEKDSLRTLKAYKFYPQNEEPNVQEFKNTFINRYYLHADEVF
ncbi:hypothetical protein NDN08_006590 [Rhodosorus marinus]|uniref:Uncharacterized protein n=1 Tax=Rhodosorus marinus TaxID=101924 RepID=A0AAV8UM02_9RHOD|nr:hypothetical protein NDN08_006590 [Rhodosorus marinus]